MSYFKVLNAALQEQWRFACPDQEDAIQTAPAGMTLEMFDPLIEPPPSPPPPVPFYIAQRRAHYPNLQQQLEMLWEAMDADPAKRLEPFYSAIKAVRDAYPP